jgi:hypothetical protein
MCGLCVDKFFVKPLTNVKKQDILEKIGGFLND